MAEKLESSTDIDRVSGQSIMELNNALKDQFLGGEGFASMDGISAKIFPSVFAAIQNCLQKPLQKHPRYTDVEFVWSGSTSEGVNIPNMSRGRWKWNWKWIFYACFEGFKLEQLQAVPL